MPWQLGIVPASQGFYLQLPIPVHQVWSGFPCLCPHQCSCFAPIAHSSPQNLLALLHAIYHLCALVIEIKVSLSLLSPFFLMPKIMETSDATSGISAQSLNMWTLVSVKRIERACEHDELPQDSIFKDTFIPNMRYILPLHGDL